ncbi:hypothetical protein QTO34_000402, partial [Cnephaeus nilssonii]
MGKRNNSQRKENVESPRKEISETEACNMTEKEFRVMVVEFIHRMDEKINNLCKNQEEMKSDIATIKNTMESFNSRLQEAEDRISELEDQVQKQAQSEQQLEKKIKKQEESLRELRDNMKRSNMRIIGLPEGKEEQQGLENLFEEIMTENFPDMGKIKVTQILSKADGCQERVTCKLSSLRYAHDWVTGGWGTGLGVAYRAIERHGSAATEGGYPAVERRRGRDSHTLCLSTARSAAAEGACRGHPAAPLNGRVARVAPLSGRGPSKVGELGACLLRHQAFQKPPPSRRLLKGLVHQRTGTQLHREKRKRALYSMRLNNIEMRQINNCAMASKCSNERKSHMSLTLNKKLEMINLKSLVVWIECRLDQSLIESKALILFKSMKAERGEEFTDEKFEGGPNRFSMDTKPYFGERTFIAREEKLMPGIRASKNSLTLLLSTKVAGDFVLKPMLIYNFKNPRALKGDAKSTLPLLCKMNNKAWRTAHLPLPPVENCSKQKISFRILLLTDNAPGHPRALLEIYNDINVIFMPAIPTSILKLSTENLWKGFTILDVIKLINDLWKEVKITLTGVGKKLILTLMDDSEGFKTLVEGVTADVVEISRELELKQSPGKTLPDEELLLMNKQTKQFLEMESTPGEYAVKVVEMTTQDIEYYINLVDKATKDLGGLAPLLKEVLWVKCHQTASHVTEKLFVKGRVNPRCKLHCLILKNCHRHPNLQQPPP